MGFFFSFLCTSKYFVPTINVAIKCRDESSGVQYNTAWNHGRE